MFLGAQAIFARRGQCGQSEKTKMYGAWRGRHGHGLPRCGAPSQLSIRQACIYYRLRAHSGGYGAMAARLTPDQKVGSSNLSGLICFRVYGKGKGGPTQEWRICFGLNKTHACITRYSGVLRTSMLCTRPPRQWTEAVSMCRGWRKCHTTAHAMQHPDIEWNTRWSVHTGQFGRVV